MQSNQNELGNHLKAKDIPNLTVLGKAIKKLKWRKSKELGQRSDQLLFYDTLISFIYIYAFGCRLAVKLTTVKGKPHIFHLPSSIRHLNDSRCVLAIKVQDDGISGQVAGLDTLQTEVGAAGADGHLSTGIVQLVCCAHVEQTLVLLFNEEGREGSIEVPVVVVATGWSELEMVTPWNSGLVMFVACGVFHFTI